MVRGDLGTLLQYAGGRPHGRFWVTMVGQGFLTGILDSKTRSITGSDIAFVYDDYETAYVGKFENKIMKEAYLADVVDVKLTEDDQVIPEFIFKFSTKEKRHFYFEPPTNISLGAGPKILDPFDDKQMELKTAGNAGEGVYAKKDIPAGRHACLYNGYIMYRNDTHPESDETTVYSNIMLSPEKTPDESRHYKKYSLGIGLSSATINIWPEEDVPGMFLPTLGAKTNHKFYENHGGYSDYESPRWGVISSVMLYKDVKKGEELFTNYGYKTRSAFPSDFLWYWELKDKVDKEIEEQKQAELKGKENRKKKERKGKKSQKTKNKNKQK